MNLTRVVARACWLTDQEDLANGWEAVLTELRQEIGIGVEVGLFDFRQSDAEPNPIKYRLRVAGGWMK